MWVTATVAFFVVFMTSGCTPPPAIPLNSAITFVPRGIVEQTITVERKNNYQLDFVFSREGVQFETIKNLIGASGICKIGEVCSRGVTIPVRWSLRSMETGAVVAAGEVDTLESHGWSAQDVYRHIGGFTVNRGSYRLKLEVLRDVPELANLKTRVMIYHPYK